jgi:hypothetical protein
MAVRPMSREALLGDLADRIVQHPAHERVRVGLDGPPPADPGRWADELVERLPVQGRPGIHISADGFLQPASLRFEAGRMNPDAFYDGWRDDAALRREVLDPAGPGGSGRVLPSLWDTTTDRATRAPYIELAANAVVVVSGSLLLGAGLPFDIEVHFDLSPAMLERRLPPQTRWTLPAYERYASEVDPAAIADMVIRLNDPNHPALVSR